MIRVHAKYVAALVCDLVSRRHASMRQDVGVTMSHDVNLIDAELTVSVRGSRSGPNPTLSMTLINLAPKVCDFAAYEKQLVI